jgi:hypothetical protein
MIVSPLNTTNIKPIVLESDIQDVTFKYFSEYFNFGLKLNCYNVFERLVDRKSNFNTSYFLTDVFALSTITVFNNTTELADLSSFNTYLKQDSTYWFANVENYRVTGSSSFSAVSSNFFFTVNLSSNEICYITKEINNTTYYLYCSAGSIYLDSSIPTLSSYLFRYIVDNDQMRLLPVNDIGQSSPRQVFNNSGTIQLTAASAGVLDSSIFSIVYNKHTINLEKPKSTFSYFLSSYDKNSINLNTSTIDSISSNFLLYGTNTTIHNNGITIGMMPLKNCITLDNYAIPFNHFTSEPEYLNRKYEKIFSGHNSNSGFENIQLQYNIGTKDIVFKPNELTHFHIISSMSPYTRLNINDSKLSYFGAVGGSSPLLADKVYKKRTDPIRNNTFTDEVNPQYLCTWLSAGNNGEKIWVDRYYNSNALTFSTEQSGSFFYNIIVNSGNESTYVFDLSSNLTFEPNNDYAYYHIGEKDYNEHINSLSSYNIATSLSLLNSNGIPVVPTYNKNSLELKFDGNLFGKLTSDHNGSMGFGFHLSAADFTKPICHSFLSNYHNYGFAVYNTDLVTSNIIIPSGNKLLFLNNDLVVYDEIQLIDNHIPINIKGFIRKDMYGDIYILGENNVIYVYNNNPNFITKLTNLSAHGNLVIEDLDVSKNRIYGSFNPHTNKKYFYYDSGTNVFTILQTASADTYGDKSKIYVDSYNKVKIYAADSNIETGNELAVQDDDNQFIIRQNLPAVKSTEYNFIHKNKYAGNQTNAIVVSGANIDSIITNIIVDDENKLIALYDDDKVAMLNSNRKLLFTKQLDFLSTTSTKYLDLIYDFDENIYNKYILIIELFSDRTLIHKLDKDFNLVKSSSLGTKISNSLKLVKSLTGYYYLKKTGANKSRFKVFIKSKPKYSTTGAFPTTEHIIDFDITTLKSGQHHFFVNYDTKRGFIELYVNGYLYQRNNVAPGKFALDNPLSNGLFIGAISAPYNITLASKLLQPRKYFLKDINITGLKLYKKPLDQYDINVHVNYHNPDRDCVWAIPVGQRSYIDTVERVYRFRLPSIPTEKYNININNLGINDEDVIQKISDEIKMELKNLTPFYSDLIDINFE